MIAALLGFPATFSRHFRTFRKYTGNHMFTLSVLNVLMSWVEGIGIALFFPLFRSPDANDALSTSFASVLRFFHIASTPTAVLPFIVAVFLLKGLVMLATFAYQAYLAARVSCTLKTEIVGNLRRVDYRTVLSTNSGFVSNLLVNEVNKVGYGFIGFIRIFPPALNVLVFFAIVLWLDWRLTGLCALMGVCAVVVIGFTGRISLLASKTLAKENGALASLLVQTVQAFKYLRATAGFGSFERRVEESAERYARADYRSGAASGLSQAASQPLMVLFLAGLLFYRAGIRHEPVGSLFVLMLYFFRIMNELWGLQFYWQTFVSYLGPTELVYATRDQLAAAVEPNGNRAFEELKSEIKLEGLSFAYLAEKPVLREVNLRIARNSTVAFVGESGSGKSTLVDLVMGTLKPDAGTISIDGVPLSEIDLETLRQRSGYVPQDAILFDDTVANNISLWKPAGDEQILDAARRAKCYEFIEAMPQKLAAEIGDRGVKLSGGQRQRIAIARELFKQPKILVLDEATSALDSESERAIQQSIAALKGQMTILIIAHRLSTIRDCDHICVLHDGRIVEEGSYDELLARPGSRFARLCQLQQLTAEAVAS